MPEGKGKKRKKKESDVLQHALHQTKVVRSNSTVHSAATRYPNARSLPQQKKIEKIKINSNQNICRAMPLQGFLRHRNTVREYTSLAGSSLFRVGWRLECHWRARGRGSANPTCTSWDLRCPAALQYVGWHGNEPRWMSMYWMGMY